MLGVGAAPTAATRTLDAGILPGRCSCVPVKLRGAVSGIREQHHHDQRLPRAALSDWHGPDGCMPDGHGSHSRNSQPLRSQSADTTNPTMNGTARSRTRHCRGLRRASTPFADLRSQLTTTRLAPRPGAWIVCWCPGAAAQDDRDSPLHAVDAYMTQLRRRATLRRSSRCGIGRPTAPAACWFAPRLLRPRPPKRSD